jgi:hypothetical protein
MKRTRLPDTDQDQTDGVIEGINQSSVLPTKTRPKSIRFLTTKPHDIRVVSLQYSNMFCRSAALKRVLIQTFALFQIKDLQ